MSQTRLVVSPDVVDMKVDGHWLLVHTDAGWIYVLNETASWLWEIIRSGHDWRDALAGMQEWTPGLEEELAAFVVQLEDYGLLRASTAPGPITEIPKVAVLTKPYSPPEITLTLPLEMQAGTPLHQDADPLLDPLAPLRFPTTKP